MKRFIQALIIFATLATTTAHSTEMRSPVSIAPYGNDKFLVVDYNNLYQVDAQGGRKLIEPSLPDNKRWNPTGVFFRKGLVYIANYNWNNVLIGTIQEGRFVQEQTLTVPGLISPEGVAVDDDLIAVANYDGSNITAFSHDGRLLWQTEMSLAHGVWVEGDFVYATALGNAERLAKLSKKTGEKVATVSARGWHGGYIYPTAVTTAAGSGLVGDLLVVDADAGAMISINTDLEEVGRAGKNGPQFWQRPYAAVAHNGALYVTDTEGQQLRKLVGGKVSAFGKDKGWKHLGSPVPYGDKSGPFCATQAAKVPFSGDLRTTLGYQGACLHNDAEGWTSKGLWPVGGPLLHRPPMGLGYAWQFDMSVDGQTFTITGSPNRRKAMVAAGNFYVFVDLPADYIVWGKPNDPAELIQQLTPKIRQEWARYQDLRWSCGPLAAFLRYGAGTRKTLGEQLDAMLTASTAKALARDWLAGTPIAQADLDDITTKGRVFYLDDLAVLTMLSNSNPAVENKKFENCKAPRW